MRGVLILLLLASAPAVAGTFYKCTVGGTVTYSEKPCGADAKIVEAGSPEPKPNDNLPIKVLSMECTADSLGNALAVGRVRNQSTKPLSTVKVVARFLTSAGAFIDSGTSYLEVTPLLPGQESSYRIYGPRNPDYGRCGLDAFSAGGEQILFTR